MRAVLALAVAAFLLGVLGQPSSSFADSDVAVSTLGVSQAFANSPVFLSATFSHHSQEQQPFVAVFEIRDSGGVTVFVKLDAGILAPAGQQLSRVYWVPDAAGEYTAHVFAVSSISEPEVLSAIQSAAFTVENSAETPFEYALSDRPSTTVLNELRNYAVAKINEDRAKFSLPPVYLSQNTAAQHHSDDILKTKQISYWMTNGEKPYMTYTRYGGVGAVEQNVGMTGNQEYFADCASGAYPCDTINPFEQIDLHQYGMVYEDESCCANIHMDNILDPFHTDVSIGIAYDDYTFVIVQNFENNYIKLDKPVAKEYKYFQISGDTPRGQIVGINIYRDELPSEGTYQQNRDSASYGFGEFVAAVARPGSEEGSIEADKWLVNRQNVEIGFSTSSIIEDRAVYMVEVLFEDEDGNTFPVMTYALF